MTDGRTLRHIAPPKPPACDHCGGHGIDGDDYRLGGVYLHRECVARYIRYRVVPNPELAVLR